MEDINLQCQFEIFNRELTHPRSVYDQEQRYSWLPVLLDIYHLIDTWVKVDLSLKKLNDKVACRKGCGICCQGLTIPINGLEFSGLSWYAADILPGETRNTLKKKMINHKAESGCPFLIDDVCIAYPLRPIACRQFFMLNNPCRHNENLWTRRRDDIYCALNPEIMILVEKKMLLFYGIKCESQQAKACRSGFLQELEKPLADYNWSLLGGKIS